MEHTFAMHRGLRSDWIKEGKTPLLTKLGEKYPELVNPSYVKWLEEQVIEMKTGGKK